VLVTGDIFVTTHYPIFDHETGGGINGFIVGLNKALDVTVPAWLQEGGTYVVPGHGRVGDEADVLTYRDMVLFIRDRVRHMIGQSMTLDDVLAARPSLDYDGRYNNDEIPWTTEMFLEAVYRDLEQEAR
jgi:glyoxylase-like metal-dependent hydrolase (beta-lactamase superfamily II)